MKFKLPVKMVLCSCLAALSYIASAFLASIADGIMFILPSIGYGLVLYFCLNSLSGRELVIKGILFLLFSFFLIALTLHGGLYAKFFSMIFPDYGRPNAGSGFGVMLSLAINTLLSFLVLLLIFIRMRTGKSSENSDKENSSKGRLRRGASKR